jgi:hypothetical protein
MTVLRGAAIAGVATALALVATAAGFAQAPSDSGEIHGLKLGLHAATMTLEGWGQLACGSDGGPPRQDLDTWADFKKCTPEATGLREVAARFDDEDEYVAKALGQPAYAAGRIGTRVAGHPVLLSALFDDDGILRGIRMVSDPRATPVERRMAHLLAVAVINRYGADGWTCTDLPPAEGESAVGGVFIKRRCKKALPGRALTVETHFLRKPGQHDIDPATGQYTHGEFDSWTRFELFDPAIASPEPVRGSDGSGPMDTAGRNRAACAQSISAMTTRSNAGPRRATCRK